MKKGILALILAISVMATNISLGSVTANAADPSVPDGATTVSAPTKNLHINFWIESGTPYYTVTLNNVELIQKSALGLNTSIGDFKTDFTITQTTESSGDETWSPVVGEKAEIVDRYNQIAVELTHSGGEKLGIELRAYDTGAAFRYILPKAEPEEPYEISGEYTQFVFPAGSVANVHAGGNQTVPKRVPVENFTSDTYMRPMTIEYENGAALTICEANLDNYGVMVLKKDTGSRTLKAGYMSYTPARPAGSPTKGPAITVNADGPASTPWRTFVIGENEAELPLNSSIVENLNEAPDEETYHFSDWVEPGTCLRAASGMNTVAIENIVDQAQTKGIKYVLLDTGWYGPEYDVNCDPRLDPKKLDPDIPSDKILLDNYFSTTGGYDGQGEGVFNTRGHGFDVYQDLGTSGTFNTDVDIPAICQYANQKDVGIILYVNGVYLPDSSGRNRFDTDELFSYFEKWGVKGVKPGFVNVRAQEFENYMQEVIASAASHHLIMTIHDEYVTTGTQRTFPNLFCTEGILGDEAIGHGADPQIAEDIATLFTRTIQGPTDHTFCWPGKGTKAYALASPLMFRSGMSVLYWYTNPNSVPEQDKTKMDFWKNMPTTWEDTKYLEGKMYEYATYARKSKDGDWYLGSLSAVTRTLLVPLAFLDSGVKYVADIYADGADADAMAGWNSAAKSAQTLENKKYIVDSGTTLERNLKYGFGYAVKFSKATPEEIAEYPVYNAGLESLSAKLAEAASLEENDYTVESWAALEEAMNAAQALVDSPETATDEQISRAMDDLQFAMDDLRSTAALTDVLARASRLVDYRYTQESWAALQEAVNDGEDLLSGGAFTQQQLDDVTAAITQAIADLVEDPAVTIKTTTYLSDISYGTESWSVTAGSQGMIKKDKNRANTEISLMVDGERQVFSKGMGLDAPGELYYHIDGLGYETFESYVGVDAGKPDMGSIIFRVYGDGILLYESSPSGTGAQPAQHFSIPIKGVKELTLQADMNGDRSGDWADWADAKFLTYSDPLATLDAISVAGKELPEFTPGQSDYYYPVQEGDPVPVVEATVSADNIVCNVSEATELPGTTVLEVTRPDGSKVAYKVHFVYAHLAKYLSDMGSETILSDTLNYGKVFNDTDIKGTQITLTQSDGETAWAFEKGVGMHANSSTDSSVVYNIEGQGYDRFEGYVGIRYQTYDDELINSPTGQPRSSVIFKIFVDDEGKPRFVSSLMKARTPAEFVSVDIRGAKKIRFVVDANGDQSADHGNWADAKFLTYADSDAYDVNVADVTGGTAAVTVNPEQAAAGETVTVSIGDVEDGKRFKSITVTDADGNEVDTAEVTQGQEYTFSMPDSDATVSVELEDVTQETHSVTLTPVEGATVTADLVQAAAGDLVTVSISEIDPGKAFQSITVTDADGNEVNTAEVTPGQEYTFSMPDSDATVTVELQDVTPETLNIRSVQEFSSQSVPFGTEFSDLGLPETAEVTLSDDSTAELSVVWNEGDYDGTEAGTYTLRGSLTLEEGITNTDGVQPSIQIVVGEESSVTAFESLAPSVKTQRVAKGTPLASLNLPQALEATVDGDRATIDGIVWMSDPTYNPAIAGTYKFAATMPDGYVLGQGVVPPMITVVVTAGESHHHSDDDSSSVTPPVTPPITPPQDTFVSDTSTDFNVSGTYQFRITSRNGAVPNFVVGTSGVFSIQLVKVSGSDYYIELTAIGQPGAQAGIYVNGVKVVVATVGVRASLVRSDTTVPFKVVKGKSYVFKLTADEQPAFGSGNSSVFQVAFIRSVGQDYFYRVTAVGRAGQAAGFYINSGKAPVAVATIA